MPLWVENLPCASDTRPYTQRDFDPAKKMTHTESIRRIDQAIAYISTKYSTTFNHPLGVVRVGENLKQLALVTLRNIGCDITTLNMVELISFDSIYTSTSNLSSPENRQFMVEGINSTFRMGIQSLLDILNQERTRLVELQSAEEQQKSIATQIENNSLQRESIKWAKIAAFAGIATILISIISIAVSIILAR